jgi:hypothetical protein
VAPPDLPPPGEPLTLDAVTFETAGYCYQGEENHQRTWLTSDGDVLTLLHFAKRPDLPAAARNFFTLLNFYERTLCSDTVRLVRFDLVEVDYVRAIWTIIKVLPPPHGAIYLGSLTFPFAEFSYVLKLQCEERGITGLRETAVFVKAMNEGKSPEEFDPEDERYEKFFPDHPLSRLRREFARLQPSIRLHPQIKSAPAFPLPPGI